MHFRTTVAVNSRLARVTGEAVFGPFGPVSAFTGQRIIRLATSAHVSEFRSQTLGPFDLAGFDPAGENIYCEQI